MRVLIVAPDWPGSKGLYIGEAFERVGHRVAWFNDWNYGFTGNTVLHRALRRPLAKSGRLERLVIEQWVDRLFLSAVRSFRPDLIFLHRSDRITPEALAEARESSRALVVHWVPDGAAHPTFYAIRATLPILDLVFVKDSKSIELLRGLGCEEARFLPQCCAPSIHRPVPLTDAQRAFYGSDVALVSSLTPERIELLRALEGRTIKVWWRYPWLHPELRQLEIELVRHRAFGEEQTRVFNATKVVLNLHRATDVHGLNLRTFEVAACGGFQLVDRKVDLEASFDEGEEIVCFDSVEELKEQVDRYLLDEPRRKEIAERARRRTHAEHTYDNRVATILDELGARLPIAG